MMFERIIELYNRRRISTDGVANAVIKGLITADEYEQIVGEPYGR